MGWSFKQLLCLHRVKEVIERAYNNCEILSGVDQIHSGF